MGGTILRVSIQNNKSCLPRNLNLAKLYAAGSPSSKLIPSDIEAIITLLTKYLINFVLATKASTYAMLVGLKTNEGGTERNVRGSLIDKRKNQYKGKIAHTVVMTSGTYLKE